ncbi:MAG: dihydroorotate dehydrogenase electron transfer subunit [Eubacteriales bacterium]|nr:dihydroorotate dehydrogenase electron transfer subunit [Eubacteriales bacterium]
MNFLLTENTEIAPGVWRMQLSGDARAVRRPGQFAQVKVPGLYLRRPISICDWRPTEKGGVTLVYKVVGHGTEGMSQMKIGESVDALLPLGNGFDVDETDAPKSTQAPLLVGGGVGTPPLYGLCRRLKAIYKQPTVVLGFGTKSEILLREEFESLGVRTIITTMDGSEGIRGLVTDAMAQLECEYDYVYACGPEPMLKAVCQTADKRGVRGQYSFEERMACGFGACMGCSCQTKYGAKRICKDGPVLMGEEIVW